MISFPHGFLWGAATAGHQVEGGNVNADMWPMEWAENSTFNEPSGDTCDHYHRYPEDIAILAELGLTAYRFSLEWSRIEPEPGFYSRAALDHYKRMIESCLHNGVTPVVTYNHFTVPRWMAGRGGWSAARCASAVRRLRRTGDAALRGSLSWVCTLNEPNLMAMMRSTGVLAMGAGDRPPRPEPVEAGAAGVGGFDPSRYRMGIVAADLERMATAHRLAVQAIKATTGTVKTGWTLALVDFQPAEGGEERWQRGTPGGPDRLARRLRRRRLRRRADVLPRPASGRTASFPCRTGSTPCRPAGRSTPKHWDTRSASPPTTPACPCS